jgi:hypothetical protein
VVEVELLSRVVFMLVIKVGLVGDYQYWNIDALKHHLVHFILSRSGKLR